MHVVKKTLAPGKGSEIRHSLIQSLELLPMPHFPKPVRHSSCIQVLNSRKLVLKCLKKDLKLIFKNR